MVQERGWILETCSAEGAWVHAAKRLSESLFTTRDEAERAKRALEAIKTWVPAQVRIREI